MSVIPCPVPLEPTMTSPIAIRRATAADAPALERLAALDSARAPQGDVLLAEVGGEPRAAVAIATGAAVADPFRPTADIVALLRLRAATLRGAAPTRRRTFLRPAALRAV